VNFRWGITTTFRSSTHQMQVIGYGGQMQVQTVTLGADQTDISGLFAPAVGDPRGVIVALPGGGYRAGYFHHPDLPQASLLTLGSAVGFHVLAVDRPGYGVSSPLPKENQDVASQAQILWDAIDKFLPIRAPGKGAFLVGHSLGSVVALQMAAYPSTHSSLLGVSFAGLPTLRDPSEAKRLATAYSNKEVVPSGQVKSRYFGPAETFEAGILEDRHDLRAPVPEAEFADGMSFPSLFGALAGRVRVPVQLIDAEFEKTFLADASISKKNGAMFSNSRLVETHIQPLSGHNISQHHVARSYHLRVLAFAEQCAVMAEMDAAP
jgi:pimeloyl-ACP methyl ester carboxylesterase